MARPRMLVSPSNHDRFKVALNSTRPSLERWDFISLESDLAVLFDTVTEDATFAGILLNEITTGQDEPDMAVIGTRCQLEVDCDSATYTLFEGLKYSAENKVVTDGAANTIAWAAKGPAGTVTRLDIVVDVPALAKLWAVSA